MSVSRMAAAVSPIAMIVPEDELKCPICLDLIDNPVTIPCGHNFCMKCIVKYWPRTLSSSYSCPHCRKSFSRLPSLHPNTMLRSMIKHAVKSKGLKPNSAVARDGDVHCDVCTGTKLRAMKTCVNCLASFCDVHLRPHLESSVLRLHGLRDPVSDMQEILCKHHKRLLEYFCKKHWECLCSLCLVKHRKCPTQTVEERRGVKEVSGLSIKSKLAHSASKHIMHGANLTGFCHCSIFYETNPLIHKYRKSDETEQLPSPEIQLNGWVVEKITSALIALKSILNTQLESVLDLQETGRLCLVMYDACGLSFDSSTSSASVLLSEDSCAVSVEEADLQAWKDYAVNVDMGFRILCTQGFQSRQHYWEVHPPVDRNSNWAIGVSYGTASDRYRTLGEDKTSWCIKSRCVYMKEAAGSELPSQGLFAYHDGVAHEVPQQYPRNVGVYLDCDRGFVSFFSVSDTKATFWYKYKVLFTDPVHPAVWLREPKSKMKISEQSSSKSQVSEVMD
ncbi:E3 ubiquitin/ISG15 ligase TRIM25-like isoform X1 [Huso huso]|uniref:E3 ubiquitin/ISG15 ligase TRIM25-like isoform X1 n=1 Tax=Huso huso TaxID=61971 RepID=A0ABR0Z096_HUSHU